jgi:hypothetical protein
VSGPVRVARVEARLAPHRWAWAEANEAAIAANWERRRARTPAMFNGRVLMVAATRHNGDRFEAEFFATDYANLIAWIDMGQPDPGVANGFAMGALQSADGAFILGRMAEHTANAGRLYFPCGTPDLSDVTEEGRSTSLEPPARDRGGDRVVRRRTRGRVRLDDRSGSRAPRLHADRPPADRR